MTRDADLDGLAAADAAMAVRCLAAVERAVEEGRLNAAKVLRAAALHFQRRALAVERLAARDERSSATLAEAQAHQQGAMQQIAAVADLSDASTAGPSAYDILARAVSDLGGHRDVTETNVAQIIFGCQDCGALFERTRPEICPYCGSVAGEFELFAPFFSATPDRIARRQPAALIEMFGSDAGHLAASLHGLGDDTLRRQPSLGEWCMKEIAGHMIDCAGMFLSRARRLLDPTAPEPPEASPLPWKLLDGMGYPDMTAADLISRFTACMDEALGIVRELEGKRK
jgi:rubrerythrin